MAAALLVPTANSTVWRVSRTLDIPWVIARRAQGDRAAR
jgi:hypothetical protein